MNAELNKIEINVRFAETDAMAVVHHSNYYSWFEMGRFHLMKQLFANFYKKYQEQEYLVPVITSQCRHYSFARFDDYLLLTTKIMFGQPVKLFFLYEIKNISTKCLVAIGKTSHVLMNNESKLLLTWPGILKKELEKTKIDYPDYFCNGDEYERYI